LKEKWYEAAYGKEAISEHKIKAWKNAVPHKDFGIPPKNEFIPTDFSLLTEPLPEDEDDNEGPILLEQNEHYELHYKLDRTFKRPKAEIYLDFKTNWAYMSPYHSVCANLATELLVDELTEFSYDAGIAGLYYSLYNTKVGVRLILKGYNHKLKTLYKTILNRITNFSINPERFPLILEMMRRSFENFDKEQPCKHAGYTTSYLLEHPRWHIYEYIEEINSGAITMEAVNAFFKNLFRESYAVALIGGNVSEEWAKDAMKLAVDTLKYTPLPKRDISTQRISKIPTGKKVVTRKQHSNAGDNNSAIDMNFQFEPREDYQRDVTIELLSDILNKPAYHELRTVQQLGYIVDEGVVSYEDVRVLYIMIQSSIASPDGLLTRIETFLEEFRKNALENLSEEEFNEYVTSLAALKAEPEKKLSHRLGRFWREISNGTLDYHRAEREIEALGKVKKEDVVQMFDQFIDENAPERRCLISLVHGNQHQIDGNASNAQENNTVVVKDPVAFRNSCETYPVRGAKFQDTEKSD